MKYDVNPVQLILRKIAMILHDLSIANIFVTTLRNEIFANLVGFGQKREIKFLFLPQKLAER